MSRQLRIEYPGAIYQMGVRPIECNIIVKVSVLIWKSDTLGLIPVETIDKP